jgi:SAM-dependent methyltransferase
MHVLDHIGPCVDSLLDVGCNAGAWLGHCARLYPGARLAGVDINETALELARSELPNVELHQAGAEKLPFLGSTFHYVTCIEVLEHLPPKLRPTAFQEMRRVLKPGGKLIVTVPHAGWFAWLDSNNIRFRFPNLYRRLIGVGARDGNYESRGRSVEWHHHFTDRELLDLAGPGWKCVQVQHGGLFLYPIMDWLSWPFYRARCHDHKLRALFERIAGWDYTLNFGRASYGVLIVFERCDSA